VKPPSRALTTFTVGFLLLDAVLLVWGGLWARSPGLVVLGAACVVGALAVVLGWYRYRRALADVERAKQELKAEAEQIRELLHRHRST
jgi:hypothetical protein